ncbi:4Fe-4S binding protein [Maridesulfovibrio hydrothermalis]|uniref:4Fe-4S ferredoxin iron-sulfur binding domain protein n=1 Tax=Maridesulfovibrio hydrothermalis AM13 = DSM 14728 TaxID=1121451 RepID=L0R638_9BACT|nr:4Fe-4S binding protein [Maridesulfovibrio hydrothermalis]CCO22149.1 4Fe-4S ferredoxin iron-sulfur binding domain protein [Maridesulfovibrio hydrothermalis AM13 = DSM 14728]
MGIFLITISYLLLAAHAVRGGDWGLAVFMIGSAGLIFTRQRWAGLVSTVLLGCGSFLWISKGAGLISLRINTGGDWVRLAVIMGLLFALTLFSATYGISPAGRDKFFRDKEKGVFRASIFLLTALLLEITRSKVSFPILMVDRFFPGWGRAEIFLLAFYASWIGGKMFTPDGAVKIRPRIWALFSVVFFGQLALGLAGAEQFLMTGKLHLPVPALIAAGPVYRGGGFFMPILFTVSVLLVGPAWCSHLCYIGAWDDLCSRMSKKRPAKKFPHALIWMRLILLFIVLAAAYIMNVSGLSGYAAVCWAAAFGVLGVLIMIYFSRKMGMMVHCTAFCPMGIVSNLLGRLSPWRMKISPDCCSCFKCSQLCRYDALRKVDIEAGRPGLSCTLCGDCISSCAGSCIGYKLPYLSFSISRKIFLVLVISLHALFIGVARV